MTAEQRTVTLRFLAEPTEINFGGKVHGGTVMKWIDQAGYTCAVGWSGQYRVTVYVGGIRFYQPIRIGDLVEVRAKLIFTGTTSIHIAVDVRAADPKDRQFRLTMHCIIIFVAVDPAGTPTSVPPWQPETEEDQALHETIQQLLNAGLSTKSASTSQHYCLAPAFDSSTTSPARQPALAIQR